MKGKNFHNLNELDIYSYPEDIVKNNNKNFIQKIIFGHNNGLLSQKEQNINKNSGSPYKFVISAPVPQIIDDQNIFTICINVKLIIGLIFDKGDNPYDYKDIFKELSNELLNNEKCCTFEDEMEIENFLITLFIDLRRYGDEIIEKYPEGAFQPAGTFIKAFLFGIDEVGKTSLVRRITTGKFNDNFFTPTRKFNIEYIQKEEGQLAFWDMPGQRSFREKWLIGLQDSNIIIYMIDVANQLRFDESKKEFWNILNNYELNDIPLLILGNKIDLINKSEDTNQNQLVRIQNEILKYFNFEKLKNREWNFLFTSVKTNFNIENVIKIIFTLVSQ